MSYSATVLKVMIASPGDVAKERQVIRDVLAEWNAVHAEDRKIVLLPVGWESHSSPELGDRPQAIINRQILRDCDLLIAAFWTRMGTPTGSAESGTAEEIQGHLGTSKPALLYFSSAPVDLDSVDQDQYSALKAFRSRMMGIGLIERYESISDFREKLLRQLTQTVLRSFVSESFTQPNDGGAGLLPPSFVARLPGETLGEAARELVVEASADKNGVIMCLRSMSGSHVQTNGRDFVQQGDVRSDAKWRGAVSELQRHGLIEDRVGKGEVFFLTADGFTIADALKTT